MVFPLDPPEAIRRALPLMDVPENADTSRGYLDLLGERENSPRGIQAVWESRVGATVYNPAQSVVRWLFHAARLPISDARPRQGDSVLDIGCGPGTVTAQLGRAVGRDGVALGVDVADAMLRQAVRTVGDPRIGFLRADARQLPFHDATFDLGTALAVLHLIPDPMAVLDEMRRVLAPNGRMVLLIPTVRGTLFDRVTNLVGYRAGMRFFDSGEIARHLHGIGFRTVHSRQMGQLLWVVADR